MTAWWGRERRGPVRRTADGRLALVAATGVEIADRARTRASRFAPAWRGVGRDDDAGEAFVRLYGELAASLATRIDRLPKQAEVELFRAAGIVPMLGVEATTVVQFQASEAARAPVFVGKGFRVGAPSADTQVDRVELETERDVYVSPGRLVRIRLQRGPFLRDIAATTVDAEPFLPFTPDVGRRSEAVWLGIASDVHPGRRLTFAIGTAENPVPRPQNAGPSVSPAPPLLLSWETWSGKPQETTILLDETRQLSRAGLIELAVSPTWRPVVAPDGSGPPLYWLRLRLQYGDPVDPIRLRYVLMDCARARGEVTYTARRLEPVRGFDGRRWRLPARPVARDGRPLELRVDDPTAALIGEPSQPWREVESLADAGPEDAVFELDHADGVVSFGDGVHGRLLPPGFDHVSAPSFRVSFGASAGVEASAVTTLVSSAPLLLGVTNPLPAEGGRAPERRQQTLARAPHELRARGRAVTLADVELLAMQAPGSLVRRAHAVSGHMPGRDGGRLPGVIGVYVVGERDGDRRPRITEAGLLAVARHLEAHTSAGVEIVAAATPMLSLRAELTVVVRAGHDTTDVVAKLTARISTLFDPIVGGGGTGWPFGGAIVHADVLRHLQDLDGVLAIDRLSMVVDGQRHRSCADISLPAHALLWPGQHGIVVRRDG